MTVKLFTRRTLWLALLASGLCLNLTGPAAAATPPDTLVQAFAFDDIITMDPAESFEISGGEIIGNTYERLIRFDPSEPSKLSG